MEISVLSGLTPLYAEGLKESQLNGAEGKIYRGKVRKLHF